MSQIRAELMKAANITPKRGESDGDFHLRLAKAVSEEIDDKTWNGISSEAQDWNNAAVDAATSGQDLPAFPDAAASTGTPASDAADAAAPSRRRGQPSVGTPEKPKAYEPKIGDRVVIKTKRGKTVEGVLVEDADDAYVLNKDGVDGDEANDAEISKSSVESLALSNTPEAGTLGATTEASATSGEPEVPEVGDSIKVETKRGKIIIGKLVEANGDDIVLKDSTGEEHELQVSKLKSWEMKVKGKPEEAKASGRRTTADAKAGKEAEAKGAAEGETKGRRRGAAAEDAKPEGRTRASNGAGVSVGQRISEIMIDNPDISQDKISAQLKKEGLDFRDNTLTLNYASTKKMLDLLKSKGKLK